MSKLLYFFYGMITVIWAVVTITYLYGDYFFDEWTLNQMYHVYDNEWFYIRLATNIVASICAINFIYSLGKGIETENRKDKPDVPTV